MEYKPKELTRLIGKDLHPKDCGMTAPPRRGKSPPPHNDKGKDGSPRDNYAVKASFMIANDSAFLTPTSIVCIALSSTFPAA